MLTRLLIYAALAGIGVGIYYGIDHLPEKWRGWLKGKKTVLVAWGAIVLPELIDTVTQIDALGLLEYAPGPWQKPITQAIGVLALVMRLRTAREAAEG